jgi:septum formation protein
MSQNQKPTQNTQLNPLQLILASSSPRRKDLLAKAGFSFHVFSVKVSESLEKNLTVDEQILQIARRKAKASWTSYKPSNSLPFLILAADTMVVIDEEPLGKPENLDQAVEFLNRLSGRSHYVKTAVALVQGPASLTPTNTDLDLRQMNLNFLEGIETTTVTFRHLNEKEIHDYVESGEPMDKAGGYGIQGFAQNFVEKISGNFDNVVGLPMNLFENLLKQGSWKIQR